jgi:oligoendopeptidase F
MPPALPTSALDALTWEWAQFEPYYQDLLNRPVHAATLQQWLADWSAVDKLASEVKSRLTVASNIDTNDTEAERRYLHFSEHTLPQIKRAQNQLKGKLLDTDVNPDGFEMVMKNLNAEVELFREENLPLLAEQTKLETEYDKIRGAQTVLWEGQELTINQISVVSKDPDRAKREKAWRLTAERQLADRDALNALWARFMDLRGKIAQNADVPDYREYKWREMLRFDYTPADCETFQNAIEQVAVPAASRIYEKRRQRLGLDRLRPWDTAVDPTGKPPLKPFETIEELVSKCEAMFRRVDPQLGRYFKDMRDYKLLDLDNRKGKAPGGYCTRFLVMKQPFIFMNAVGTHDDVQTVLHEGGHAFHVVESADLLKQQLEIPTEFAEVASMSMELLAAPYLDEFYTPAEAARARIEHLEGIILFWPYMAVVDAFQQWVYTHHQAATDAANCDAKWAELWARFMPGVDWSDFEEVKKTGWHRKLHIFQVPFYYVEYGLAQLGAVQVWAGSLDNQTKAVADYRKALALGGTRSLPELFSAAGAKFAFDAGTMTGAVTLLEHTLAQLEKAAGY